jgi:hypothetical protein
MVLSLAALGVSSCGKSGPQLSPVEGKVTLTDGKPVASGSITLFADASRGNTSKEVPAGTIQDGTYSIYTSTKKGAPLGAYKVSISAAKEVNPDNPYVTEWIAEERYVDPARSGLTLEVVEKPEPGRYDFKIKPHPSQKRK